MHLFVMDRRRFGGATLPQQWELIGLDSSVDRMWHCQNQHVDISTENTTSCKH